MMTRLILYLMDFNPRSREGSDEVNTRFHTTGDISIHAPAKGATHSSETPYSLQIISIHAPAKGATVSAVLPGSSTRISIHAPAKGATANFAFILTGMEISIHAPAKGATNRSRQYRWMYLYFNPRSREGSDYAVRNSEYSLPYFNPRSREGSDINDGYCSADVLRFQSTLPRRERHLISSIMSQGMQFQSTLPRRERLQKIEEVEKDIKEFQSTLPRRERLRLGIFFTVFFNFNPRSREGSDPCTLRPAF